MGIFYSLLKLFPLAKRRLNSPVCYMHSLISHIKKSSRRPWKPTGLGVEGVSWLGPPALILDWVGVAGSWGLKQLAWWWLRDIGKVEGASLISMKSTGRGEMSWPRWWWEAAGAWAAGADWAVSQAHGSAMQLWLYLGELLLQIHLSGTRSDKPGHSQ